MVECHEKTPLRGPAEVFFVQPIQQYEQILEKEWHGKPDRPDPNDKWPTRNHWVNGEI